VVVKNPDNGHKLKVFLNFELPNLVITKLTAMVLFGSFYLAFLVFCFLVKNQICQKY